MTELGRRAFFARLLSGGASLAETNVPSLSSLTFPKRQLGRTGEWVPILGFGTSGLGKGVGDDVAAQLLNRAVDLGVNYIDTGPAAAGYERAQIQIGRALSKRRAEIFLVSKVFESGADAARIALEQNLRELRTDHVDLILAHSIGHDRIDPDLGFSDEGVFDALMRAKQEGLARYIGVSGYNRADRVVRALADYDLDVVMTTANFVDVHTYDFEGKVWPLAHRKGLGVVANKVYGGVKGGGHTPALMDAKHHALALRYALSLPGCATAVVGMVNGTELDDNVRRARAFSPLTEGERAELLTAGAELALEWGEHLGSA
jgi:aryl-alcohol dehydrogenase-like predicted oxidoreductase